MKHKMNDTKPTRTQILTTFRKLLFSDDLMAFRSFFQDPVLDDADRFACATWVVQDLLQKPETVLHVFPAEVPELREETREGMDLVILTDRHSLFGIRLDPPMPPDLATAVCSQQMQFKAKVLKEEGYRIDRLYPILLKDLAAISKEEPDQLEQTAASRRTREMPSVEPADPQEAQTVVPGENRTLDQVLTMLRQGIRDPETIAGETGCTRRLVEEILQKMAWA
ncbi:hypothetical protein [Faecalibaculum rodentium]|uniref:hypothetical protein n=1 Tax=Faecalibaculum rodentium TaxID=1702221 RepID=UPI0023F21592|nr:hypothetical protein [Faecalibaculum rodentium]